MNAHKKTRMVLPLIGAVLFALVPAACVWAASPYNGDTLHPVVYQPDPQPVYPAPNPGANPTGYPVVNPGVYPGAGVDPGAGAYPAGYPVAYPGAGVDPGVDPGVNPGAGMYPAGPPVLAAVPASPVQLTDDQIDQLVAPIALYPDPLIAQILPAATYPLEVATAAQWRQANPAIDDAAIDAQAWEPSVRAVAHYPDVLQMMAGNLTWTQELGAVFLNQQADVMNSIQRLRAQAQADGALTASPQQQVLVQDDGIYIEPVDPAVLYVPIYDPQAIFFRHRPGERFIFGDVIRFGLGLRIGLWLDNDCDWHDRWVAAGGGWHNGWRAEDDRRAVRPAPNFGRPPVAKPWSHNPAQPVPVFPQRAPVPRSVAGNAPRIDPRADDVHRGRAAPATDHPVVSPPVRPANPGVFVPSESRTEVDRQVNRAQQSHPTPTAPPAVTPRSSPPRAETPASPHPTPPAAARMETPAPSFAPRASAFTPSGSGAEVHAQSARGNASLQQQQPASSPPRTPPSAGPQPHR